MNKLAKELLKKNNSREKAIFHENEEVYTNMVVYLRGSDLTDYDQEIVRGDVIELILDGQQRGDNIQKVMGGRYKETCDEIIEVMPKKTKKVKAMEFVDMLLNVLCILGVISLIGNFIDSLILKKNEFNFILTVGDIISLVVIIVISNAIVWFITKTAFDTKKEKKVVYYLKMWIILVPICFVIIFSKMYFKTVAMSIPLWLAMIFILFIFVVGKTVNERV